MDQLKNFLAFVKKHHFWILCGLAVLIGLGMTLSAKSKLLKSYDDEKSKISGAQASVAPFATGTEHPNQKWIDDVNAKTGKARLDVFDAWKALYQKQAEKVFVWPTDVTDDPKFLTEEFAVADDQTVNKLDRKKLTYLCDQYTNYITKVTLPRLAAIIDAEWTVSDSKNPVVPDPTREPVSHKLSWDSSDQQHRFDDYNWGSAPSRLDIQYAQEEMWIMEALFNAIKRANSKAGGAYDAPVRQLTEVLVGYDATNRTPLGEGAGRIIRTVPTTLAGPGGATADSGAPAKSVIEPRRPDRQNGVAGGGGAGSRSFGRGGRGPSGPADSSAPTGLDMGGGDPTAWLKDGRYVDADCQPLSGSEQNSKAPEYKLMAFRLKLLVDEAQYSRIIEELASSVLPIEVREVRILPNGESATRSIAPARGSQSPGRGRGIGRPMPSRDSSAPTSRGPAGPSGPSRPMPVAPSGPMAESGVTQHNIPIEIYGVVYLVQRPDPKALSLPDTATSAATSTAAAPPGAVAPVSTTTEAPGPAATTPTTTQATATTPAPTATTPTATAAETPPAPNGATPATPPDASKGNGAAAATAPAATAPADVAPK